ncbi:MAG: glycosyltransferase family 87 protein [Terracidiphilus sp.]
MRPKRASTQRKALLCLLLSVAISITWASVIAATSHSGMGAFKAIFYGVRCLIRHSDPYNPAILQQVYESEGGRFSPDPAEAFLFRRAMLVCVNLPTSLFLIAPLAVLPWKIAALVWMVLNIAGFSIAAFLLWMTGRNYALKPSTLIICFLLANAELVLALGNLAGIATGLCMIAAWCFLEERFVLGGIFCLAVGLALKPHDAGLVWFYFLLAGGVYRRRALQTLAVVAALTLPAILWISYVAPQWPRELRANMHALSAHGSVNDPGPDSLTFRSPDYVISLQSPFSLIRDAPGFYNSASYLTCGLLLLAGAIRVLKSRFTKRNAWIALAAVAPLSMLPVYHRAYDAKLLLLAVPACALLWREGGRLKWLAGLMTTLAVVSTGDVPATILLGIMNSTQGLDNISGRLLTAFVFHPAPLVLLATGVFYLWVYFRCTAQERPVTVDACAPLSAPMATNIGGSL